MSQFRAQISFLQIRRWQRFFILLLTLGVLFAARPVNGSDFFVAPDGSESCKALGYDLWPDTWTMTKSEDTCVVYSYPCCLPDYEVNNTVIRPMYFGAAQPVATANGAPYAEDCGCVITVNYRRRSC